MSTVYVRLRVGGEWYAVAVEHVVEVSELGALSAVPGAGAAVLGVRNLNGHVLPVFDLARVLAIEGEPSTSRVLVAEHHGRLAGLAVDEVSDVSGLASEPEEAEADHLRGAVLEGDRLVGIIDVERLFDALAGAVA